METDFSRPASKKLNKWFIFSLKTMLSFRDLQKMSYALVGVAEKSLVIADWEHVINVQNRAKRYVFLKQRVVNTDIKTGKLFTDKKALENPISFQVMFLSRPTTRIMIIDKGMHQYMLEDLLQDNKVWELFRKRHT
jgi:hypothetical protein